MAAHRRSHARRVLTLSAAVAAVFGGARATRAATYDWDATPGNGVVDGGTGDWNTSALNWTLNGGAANVAWPNANTDVARFGVAGGAVSLTTPLTANGLAFTANGYTIQNNGTATNTLTLAGATPSVDVGAGVSATVTAVLAGGTDNTIYFTKTGDGSLTLNAANTFLGDVRITNGAVVAQTGAAFGGGATSNGTRIILDQDAGKTATVQINTGYDPAAASAASFDRYLFGPGGGTINVASGQQLTLNDANQFGDHTGATASTVFTKAGPGTVLLQTQNYAFTGTVVVNEGTLRVDGAGNLGAAGNANTFTVNSGGTFDLRSTLSNAAKAFVIAGPGAGNAGALVNGGTNAVAVGTVTLNGGASLGGAGQLTVGSIGESAAGSTLTKVGAGLTILNAANSYTGNTVVAGGVLRDTGNTSLPNTGGTLTGNLNLAGGAFETRGTFGLPLGTGPNQVQFSGGTSAGLSANGAALTVNVGGAGAELAWGAGDFNPGTLILNASTANAALTLQNPLDLNAGAANVARTINVGANSTTIGTLIRDSSPTNTAGLTKTGGGTLFLTNPNNSYDGTTTINAGVLSVASLPDGPTSPIGGGGIAFTSGTGSGTLQYTGNTAIVTNRAITVGGNNAVIDVTNAAGGIEIPTSVGGNAANTITKAGPGTLTLSGTGDNASFLLNATGGVTLLNKTGATTSRAVAGIAGIAPGATVRLVPGSSADQIYGGNATSTTGQVNITGGTLDLNTKSESIDRLTGYGTVTNGGAAGTTSTLTIGETGGTNTGYAGNISDGPAGGKVALAKVGAGTQTLLGGGNYSGGTTVSAGTLRVQSSNALGAGPVTLGGGTLALAGSRLSGFGGTGVGYALNGGPTVAGDVLTLTTATGSLARSAYNNNRVDVRSFTTSFRYDNGTNGGGADGFTFILQNQGLNALGANGGAKGYQTIAPSVALVFNIFNADSTSAGKNGNQTDLLPSLATVPATLLDLADVTATYDGTNLSFTVTNPNNTGETITRSFAVDLPTLLGGNGAFVGFTGGTGGTTALQTISNFSYASNTAVNLPNAVTLPSAATAGIDVSALASAGVGALSLGAGSTLNVTGTSTGTNAPYALTAGATTLTGPATVNVANNGTGAGTLTLGAVDGGANGLTKTGAGTLILSAAGTLGQIDVNAGTLRVQAGILSAGGAVASGASLAGRGSISGPVTVAGTIAPGNSVGTLGTGSLTLQPASTYALELDPANAGGNGLTDLINVTGGVTLTDSLLAISLLSPLSGGESFTIIANDGTDPVTGTFANAGSQSAGGFTFTVLTNGGDGNDVVLTNAVPEPAAAGLIAAAGLLAGARRRRRS